MLDASSLNFDMPRCEKSDMVTDENMETMGGWMFFPQPSDRGWFEGLGWDPR